MFQGFTDETFEFFMAIGFNNNREFFHANHDWYVRALRGPCLELAGALAESVRALDPDMETRPEKVVARINRDLRFSNDKSPYRDYIWLAWRRPNLDKSTTMGAYFDMSADAAHCGLGFWGDNKPLLNGLRRRLRENPQELLSALPGPEYGQFVRSYKRMAVPEGIPDALSPWYRGRSFYLERDLTDFSLLKSPALVEAVAQALSDLTPLYRFFESIVPEEDSL